MSSILAFFLIGNVANLVAAQLLLVVKITLSCVFFCEFIHIPADREDFAKIQSWLFKYHKICSWYVDTDSGRMPSGLVIGRKGYRPFLAWVTGIPENTDKEKGAPKPCKDIFLITWLFPSWIKSSSFEKDGSRINQSDKPNQAIDKPSRLKLKILQPVTAWVGDKFREMKINVSQVAYQWQLDLVEQVKQVSSDREDSWQSSGSVTLLQGPPGTGKSEVAKVLAAKMNAILVPDFDPTKAGHWLASIVKIADPTAEQPLVIVMDEVDGIIKHLFERNEFLSQVKWLFLQVYNKKSWNQFFDKLHKDYEHIHIIMTSNTKIDDLKNVYGEKWDPSLLRIGRIDQVITVGEGYNQEDETKIIPNPKIIDYSELRKQKLQKYSVENPSSVDKITVVVDRQKDD